MENGEIEMERDGNVSSSYGYQSRDSGIWYQSETVFISLSRKNALKAVCTIVPNDHTTRDDRSGRVSDDTNVM